LCVVIIALVKANTVFADGANALSDEARLTAQITSVYRHIDFSHVDRLPFHVFETAYKGYLNLKNAGKLSGDKDILSVCDFDLPSTENRLWIIDLATHKVLFNTYVAHGQGSGEDCAEQFSNKFNSHQSSLGFYVTSDTYNGEHGMSLRLQGMDQGYNDAALDRGIVVHGADYVSSEFITGNVRLGRSWGCPAVPDRLKTQIISTIVGGTCLFVYYPDAKYLKTAYWLNKKPEIPQGENFYSDLLVPTKPPVKYIIQYMHGNRVDSTRTVEAQK